MFSVVLSAGTSGELGIKVKPKVHHLVFPWQFRFTNCKFTFKSADDDFPAVGAANVSVELTLESDGCIGCI